MVSPTLSIGKVAARSGTNPPTVRYYEEIGLLKAPQRRSSGHRAYSEDDVRRLTFIRRCRDFGFPLDEVRQLVNLVEDGDRSCEEVRTVGNHHLQAVRFKLAELVELERNLAAFVDDCSSACAGGPSSECVVLAGLSTELQVARRTHQAGR